VRSGTGTFDGPGSAAELRDDFLSGGGCPDRSGPRESGVELSTGLDRSRAVAGRRLASGAAEMRSRRRVGWGLGRLMGGDWGHVSGRLIAGRSCGGHGGMAGPGAPKFASPVTAGGIQLGLNGSVEFAGRDGNMSSVKRHCSCGELTIVFALVLRSSSPSLWAVLAQLLTHFSSYFYFPSCFPFVSRSFLSFSSTIFLLSCSSPFFPFSFCSCCHCLCQLDACPPSRCLFLSHSS
jgi:hypothetical protein